MAPLWHKTVLGVFLGVFLVSLIFLPFVGISQSGPINRTLSAPNATLAEEPIIGFERLEAHGVSTYLGGDLWSYKTSIGESNVWNGTDYLRYIYDVENKQIRIGELVFTHGLNGVISISKGEESLIGVLKWYAQYYFNSAWQNFTFDNYEYLGAVETKESITVSQRWYATNGELNVSYTYRFWNEVKMQAKATNWAAQVVPVRILWALTDISISPDYTLVYDGKIPVGVELGNGQSIYWYDVAKGSPDIAINTVLDKEARRAAVVFGNQSSILAQYETLDIDPTYTIAADSDDDWWRDIGSGWEHMTTSLSLSLTNQSGAVYIGGMRFQMAIPKDAVIDSADYYFYEENDPWAYVSVIKRINETDVGSLEGDTIKPIASNASGVFHSWDTIDYEWKHEDITDLLQIQVNLAGWTGANYFGIQWWWNSTFGSGVFTIEDYQATSTNHSYIEATYTYEYDYVDTISNLHSPSDVGTHSSFAEEQDSDLVYDNLTEANAGGSGGSYDYEYNYSLDESSTGMTHVDKVSITIEPASGSHTYLVLGMAQLKGSATSSTQFSYCNIIYDDTTTMSQVVLIAKDSTDYVAVAYCAYETVSSGTPLRVDMEFYSNNAANTAYLRDAQLFAIEVTAEIEDEDLSRTTTTSATWQTKSTISVTPTGTEDFLIFSSMIFDCSSTTYSSGARLYNGASALQTDWQEMTLTSGSSNRYQFVAVRYVSISGSTTYSNQYSSENTGNTCGASYSHLIAVPVANFPDVNYQSSTGSTTLTAGSWINKVSLLWTPNDPVQHIILGTAQTGSDSTSYSVASGLLLNGSTVDYDDLEEDKDTSDWHSHLMFSVLTPSVGSRNDTIQGYTETGNTGADIQQAWIFAIQTQPSPIKYDLDLEVGWISADYDETNKYLCIYGGSQGTEALRVDIWDSTGSAWVNVITDLAAGWNNYSVASYVNDATVEVRFTDTTDDNSTVEMWQVDAVLLHCYAIVGESVQIYEVFSISEDVTTAESVAITINQLIVFSETVITAMNAVITILESIAISCVVTTKWSVVLLILEEIGLSSIVTTILDASVTVSDVVTIFSSVITEISVGMEYVVSIYETIGAYAVISTVLNSSVTISAVITVFDSVEAVMNPAITIIINAVIGIGIETTVEGGLEGLDFFYDLFLSGNMWSYLGPIAMVIIGYIVAKRERIVGILWFTVECLFIYEYLSLVAAHPTYWWHIFILLLGGLFGCIYPLWDRQR